MTKETLYFESDLACAVHERAWASRGGDFLPFCSIPVVTSGFFFYSQTPRYFVTESNRIASLAHFVPIHDVFSLKAENG